VVKDLKERMRTEQWILAEYCLRFISDLVNSHVISSTSLLQLYDGFFVDVSSESNTSQVFYTSADLTN